MRSFRKWANIELYSLVELVICFSFEKPLHRREFFVTTALPQMTAVFNNRSSKGNSRNHTWRGCSARENDDCFPRATKWHLRLKVKDTENEFTAQTFEPRISSYPKEMGLTDTKRRHND